VVALEPSAASFTAPALVSVLGSFCFAFMMLLSRALGTTPDRALVFWQTAGASLVGIVAAPFGWVPPDAFDLMLRTGPHGDGFGRRAGGLSLRKLEESPHGVDLGPLKPRVPQVLGTPDGMIDLAPALILSDLPRLRAEIERPERSVVLIGRRQVRSNNSWMHNVYSLVKGPKRCTLLMSEEDAGRARVESGDHVTLSSSAGSVIVPVEVTSEMMPGVVSLPHGWGHDREGVLLSVARARAGVNVNIVSDDRAVDPVSGNAAFNGLPVRIEPWRGEAGP
jgi:hypothetical protein